MWFRTVYRGVHLAFTDAAEGNLAVHTGEDPVQVAANRSALERSCALPQGSIRYLNQVHGIHVEVMAAATSTLTDPRAAPTADAAVTAVGTPLAVLTADCLPVIFVGFTADGNTPVTGVAHAGRRGLLDGVLDVTVDQLQKLGAREIHAWIGPAICGECYEVPQPMQEEARESLNHIASTTSWGTPGLNLPGAAKNALTQRGVEIMDEPNTRGQWCTLEHPQLPSYRRDATTARLAGVVWTSREEAQQSPDTAQGTRKVGTS